LNRVQGRGINAPLNETGIWQAQRVAEALSEFKPQVVFSSSLIRAQQTAEHIVKRLELDLKRFPQPDRDLDEMDFGVLEGALVDEKVGELQDLINGWKNGNTSLAAAGGESPEQVYERASRKIYSILHDEAHATHSTFVFVIHGRLLRVLLSKWLGYGLQGMQEIPHHNAGLNYVKWMPKANGIERIGSNAEPKISMNEHAQFVGSDADLLGTGVIESVFINRVDHLVE
jgi:probable phosphoglycerate mutase